VNLIDAWSVSLFAIVLDLRAVEAIDAGGLGLFVFLHTCAHGLGTELKLRNPPQRMAELLRLTNLDFVLEIFPTENVVPRHAAVARQPMIRTLISLIERASA
jgi:anti-anti-sigma factor